MSSTDPVITRADTAAWAAVSNSQSTELQRVIVAATRALTPSLSQIARDAGVAGSTVSSWRRGLRVPTPDSLDVLADVMEEHAHLIMAHAQVLRMSAADLRTPTGRTKLLRSQQPG